LNIQKLALILLAGIALGSSASIARVAVAEIEPLTLTLLRFVIATLVYAVTLAVLRLRLPRDTRTWRDIGVVGLSQGFQVLAFTFALLSISGSVLSIFIAMVPLFTAIMVQFWLVQERLNWKKWLGLLVAFAGVGLLILTRTTGLLTAETGRELQGQLLALAGAAISAAGVVYARRHLREVDAVIVSGGQIAAALVLVLPFALGLGSTNFQSVSPRGWLAALYISLSGSYLGFLLLFYMVRRYGATASVLPAYVMPAVAAAIGVLFLGEIITVPLVGSAVLILVGLFLASQ
jgi:drug/metabolite transporter (DMT)-like permease